MRRGEVYLAALEPRSGSEQRGRRPVVAVSHDAVNETPAWRSVIVVPLTTSPFQARRGPSAVAVPGGHAGLERDSTALCHQVTTLDRAKLVRRIGSLPFPDLLRVAEGLRAATDL
ncbi:MAG: type II toxin-antitoxin system PemK/MazF family toxin [Planctomycetes bacterium]|nr:type II toxin-antitoxin system PemK/MazF family toxin [Planctomycetota bacterium]